MFEVPFALAAPDDRFEEERFLTIGRSRRARMIVVPPDRGRKVRIIGARPATRRERKQHEQS